MYDSELIPIFGIMIPIISVIMTAIVFVALMYFRYRERTKLHETLRALSQTDSPHQQELLAALTRSGTPQADRDLRMAFVLFSAAAGFLALAFLVGIEDEPYEVVWPLVAIAVFPAAFGFGRLILWRMARKRGEG